MTNNQRICYVVGAMSLSPSLRPYPAPGDYVIAAEESTLSPPPSSTPLCWSPAGNWSAGAMR